MTRPACTVRLLAGARVALLTLAARLDAVGGCLAPRVRVAVEQVRVFWRRRGDRQGVARSNPGAATVPALDVLR